MEKMKIDLLREKYRLDEPKPKPFSRVVKGLALALAVCATFGAVFSYNITTSGDASGLPPLSLFGTIRHLVGAGERGLASTEKDRVNFLLMGVGGAGHDGPQLADTILFASYKPSTKEVGIMSIPRDMAVPIPGYGWRKVNAANAFGEQKEPGAGPELASEVITSVLDQPIDYYVRVDFNGFSEIIDEVGGVTIYVDRAFTDTEYPILGKESADCGTWTEIPGEDGEPVRVPTYGCRYEALRFEEGLVHMDGATALKYVRSRHGSNGEGSDFARSRRQQKVLLAVKDQVFSSSTFLNPSRLSGIFSALNENIATNLSVPDILTLATALKDFDASTITSYTLDSSPSSPLYATSLNGAYVLLPKNDDWTPIQQVAEHLFDETPLATTLTPNTGTSEEQKQQAPSIQVEIQNGTTVSGLAFRTSQLLDTQGYNVVKVGNAEDRAYEHTVIYDLTDGTHATELAALANFLKADVTRSAAGWLVSDTVVPKEISVTPDTIPTSEEDIDFLVILGSQAASLVFNN